MSGLPATCQPSLESVTDLTAPAWDCLVLVLPSFKYEKNGGKMASILNSLPQELRKIVREAKDLDAASTNSVTLVQVKENGSFGRSVSLLVGRSVGRLVGR